MKILVRAPNWVGDAVMAIPALQAIRRMRADDEICVLARPAVADLFLGQPFADRIMPYDFRGQHAGWLGREKLIAELRKEKFDIAVLLQNAFDAAWLAWRAGIPERIGYARDGRGAAAHAKRLACRTEGEIPKHESHYYLELLHRAGWIESPAAITPIRLLVSDAARASAESALHNCWRARKELALRDRSRSFLRRGKMLAAGAFCATCRPTDFRMRRRCDIFWHAG